MFERIGRVAMWAILGGLVLSVVLSVVGPLTGFLLVRGTDFFLNFGLTRPAAGTLAVLLVVLLAVTGLGTFARYGIDWN